MRIEETAFVEVFSLLWADIDTQAHVDRLHITLGALWSQISRISLPLMCIEYSRVVWSTSVEPNWTNLDI